MKKTFKSIVAILLAGLMLLALVSCGSKANAIQKAFEDEGYTVVKSESDDIEDADLKKMLADYDLDKVDAIMSCTNLKKASTVLVISYKSASALKDSLTEKQYKAAEEAEYINGNCLLVRITLLDLKGTALDIFKNA